jgi:hypothetical protein
MFLSLEFPGGDKHITFYARDLAGDEGFDPCRPSFSEWDSDRNRADRVVQAANRELGAKPFKYFSTLFNQFTWEGTTGWEYWSRDYDKVLKHALVVAAALGLPLHVHKSFDDALLDAAVKAGVKLDFVAAERVANPVTREFEYSNRQLDNGEYVRLIDVVLPEGTPSIEVD